MAALHPTRDGGLRSVGGSVVPGGPECFRPDAADVSTIGFFPWPWGWSFPRILAEVSTALWEFCWHGRRYLGGTGDLTLCETLRVGGKASVVFPLTSMSPLVTIVVAGLLPEES